MLGVLLTMIFLMPGLLWGYASVASFSGTEMADGVVIGIEDTYTRNENSGCYSYRPIVEYIVAERRYRCKTFASFGSKAWAIGERMRVRYKPDDPEAGKIDSFFELWLGPLALTFFAPSFCF